MTTDTKIVTVATNPKDVFHSGQLTTLKNSETLKGSASGEIIGIDNISSVEHTLGVKVSSKNLFKTTNYSKGSILIADGSVSSAAHVRWYVETSDYIPLKAGTYTVSYKTGANLRYVCLYNKNKETIGNFWSNRKNPYTFTIDEDCLVRIDIETAKVDDVQPSIENYDTFFADFEVQLELGDTVTKYIPYVPDLSTVNVKTAGKNLVDIHNFRNSIIFSHTVEDNKLIATKTNDYTYPALIYTADITFLPKGSKILLSASNIYSLLDEDSSINNFPNCMRLNVYYEDGTLAYPSTNKVLTATKNVTKIEIWFNSPVNCGWGANDTVVWEDVMLTVNDDSSVIYEPYVTFSNYSPNSNGVVEGVVNIYPSMTLLTDTNGAIIDCNYYKDIDKTFDELLTNVALSGGEG